jgi:hypothetical protein
MVNEAYMAGNRAFFAAAVLGLGVLMALSGRASAEFFGCDDQHPSRTYTRTYTPRAQAPRSYTSHYASHEFAAQRRPQPTYYSHQPFEPLFSPRTGFH